MNTPTNPRLTEEINNIPAHIREELGASLVTLFAALRLYGFQIIRADAAKPNVTEDTDLWVELSHPSIWIQSPDAGSLAPALKAAQPDSPEHKQLSNQLIRANLEVQQRLLRLLEDFYSQHSPASFYSRLVVDTIDQGESYLRPQGASTRLIADVDTQKKWFDEAEAEVLAFVKFLAKSLDA